MENNHNQQTGHLSSKKAPRYFSQGRKEEH